MFHFLRRLPAEIQNLGFAQTLQLEIQKRLQRSVPFKLSSKQIAFPVSVRPNTTDIKVFYQIFVFDEYSCLSHVLNPNLIFDLGANVGYSSAYFLTKFKNCRVIAVEPDPENYAQLVANLAPYGDRVTTVNAAVWPRDEKLDFTYRGEHGGWGVQVGVSETGAIPTVSVPSLFQMSGSSRVAILKMDIEGSEVELFRSATDDWMNRVDNFVIELHGKEAHELFQKVIQGQDFKVTTHSELTVCTR